MPKTKILIVDDEEAIRELLSEICVQVSDQICLAPDGRTALEAVRNETPDVIILDQNMPDFSGIEVLASLHQAQNPIPVIMVTGEGSLQLYRNAWSNQVFDYFQKPFDHQLLLRSVRTALEANRDGSTG